ncbi:MAG: GNAT family N-acetyltransferase [Cyclobacteriaceae bacterium]|nr:GNAT family N-acetyltransferase [Cyclobacteriaceae bacterium]
MNFLLTGIETERIHFREIRLADSAEWIHFFEDPASFRYWKEEHTNPKLECARWYEKQQWRYQNNRGGMNALIEKSSGQLIGHAGLVVQTVDDITELEIAYSLMPAFRGRGFASEAAQQCKITAFQNQWAASLISIISVTNTPSIQVATRNGMTIDKKTMYNGNEVYIFRILQEAYLSQQ